MKKTLAALLPYLAALFLLTACGGSATQSVDAEPVTGRSGLDVGTGVAELDANPNRAIRRSIEPIWQTLITRFDGTSVPEDFYLYRNTLSESYQDAYDQVCNALMKRKTSIVLSTPVPERDFQYVYQTALNDHPEIFWVTTKWSYSYNNDGMLTEIRPTYYDIDVDAATAEFEESVDEALAAMWGLDSDVERVKYAHDYLTHTITYTHNEMDQSAYSGFVWKETVCAGYAKCFSYMMHKMGIPCASVIGDAGGAHAWNILELDGEFYMMDVTWDDHDQGPDVYSYNYFNITDKQISANHTRGVDNLNISLELPQATGTAMSYENAFDGDAYGTDFDAIEGVWPDDDNYDDDDDNYDDDDYDYDDDDYDYDDDDYDYDDDDDNYDDDDYDYDDDDYDYDDDDYDYDDDDYDYDDYYDDGEWWKWLDDSWEKSDWEYDGDGLWYIYDDETDFTYVYDEDSGIFGAFSDDNVDEIYWLDPDTGEWGLMDDTGDWDE